MKEHTFAIIKPEAVKSGKTPLIMALLTENNLAIEKFQTVTLTEDLANKFYAEHSSRPWFKELTDYMTSGPIVIMELSGDNAVKAYRELMGATDPSQAQPGTIRAKYAESKAMNAVHGSDSDESARRELDLFRSLF